MTDTVNCMWRRKETRRPQMQALNGIVAEMLIESRPPGCTHAIAQLQNRFKPRAEAASYKTKMAPMLSRHQFEDSVRFPVTLNSDHNAFIGPLHVDIRLIFRNAPFGRSSG